MGLKDILTQPATVATSSGIAIANAIGLTWFDPLISVLLGNLNTVFTALSVTGFTIAPEISWLPQDTLTTLTLAVAGLYVLKLLHSLLTKVADKQDD